MGISGSSTVPRTFFFSGFGERSKNARMGKEPLCLSPGKQNAVKALFKGLLPLLLLLALPAMVQAQFDYVTNNGTITVTGYAGPGGNLTMPSTTNGLPVTSIGNKAFAYCTNLASITIPASVTNLGQGAFYFCTGLTNVTIPASVTRIGQDVFCYCWGLTSVTIPTNVISIGSSAFYDCYNLTNVTIPDSVTSIGEHAFSFCARLTSVTVPTVVTNNLR
jgi:hypothetical protein